MKEMLKEAAARIKHRISHDGAALDKTVRSRLDKVVTELESISQEFDKPAGTQAANSGLNALSGSLSPSSEADTIPMPSPPPKKS